MRGFLKCFYGYRNLGDEVLFRGVVDYIHRQYPDITELTVEVGDVSWMESRYDDNKQQVESSKSKESTDMKINFVEVSKDIRDNFRYDIYFFGGGEVFMGSRGRLHGGWNYVLRYFFAINSKPFVILGGIENPTTLSQKILYKYLLPKAKRIVCRESSTYELALMYNRNSELYHDFAIDVVEKFSDGGVEKGDAMDRKKSYILVNMITKMATEEGFEKVKNFIELYPDCQIVYVHCGEEDRQYGDWLAGAYPDTQIYDWTAHSLQDTLSFFAHAKAGIGCRLHFLLLLQELGVDRHALVYAEKVQKLIQSNIVFPQ